MPRQSYTNPLTGLPFTPRLNVPAVFGNDLSYEDQILLLLSMLDDALEKGDIETITNLRNAIQTAADTAGNAQTAADNAQTAAGNAQTAADNAQTAADNAQTAADNAQTAADGATSALENYVTKATATATYRKNNVSGLSALIIGDSIANGYLSTTPWPTLLGNATGMTIHNYAENRSGFTTVGDSKHFTNFIGQATAAHDEGITPNIVIVAGGINDSVAASDVYSEATSCLEQIRNYWPQCLIVVVPCYGSNQSLFTYNSGRFISVYNSIIRAAGNIGAICITNGWLWNYGERTNMNNDNIHPNLSGATLIAQHMVDAIMGAPIIVSDMVKGADFLNVTDGVDTSNMRASMQNGIATLHGNLTITADIAAFTQLFTVGTWCARTVNGYFYAYGSKNNQINTTPIALYITEGGQLGTPSKIEYAKYDMLFIDHSWVCGS